MVGKKALAALCAVAACAAGCDIPDEYLGGGEATASPVERPVVELRRETLGLEISLYRMLSQEYGVGEWKPQEEQIQTKVSAFVVCPAGYSSELYRLATAAPIPAEKWKAATARIYELAKPYGFGKPEPYIHTEGNAGILKNPRTGAELTVISHPEFLLIEIDTGCGKDNKPQGYADWPRGTEVVPDSLRSTGRGLSSPEEWAPYDPNVAVTPPPSPAAKRSSPKAKPAETKAKSASAKAEPAKGAAKPASVTAKASSPKEGGLEWRDPMREL